MRETLLLWDAYTGELWSNLPHLIHGLFWITIAHIAAWAAWCEISLQRQYSGRYVLEDDRIGPAWLLTSFAAMTGFVNAGYPLYCLYRAIVFHFLPYFYLTGTPIPWPLSIFFT